MSSLARHRCRRPAGPIRSRRFYAIEFVIGMGILMIVLAAFSVYFGTLRRAHLAFVRENRCLLVLDNTLERLRALPRPDADDAGRLLAEEFAAMPMPDKTGLVPAAEPGDSQLTLAIRRPDGIPVASLEVPLP